jgi:hypothetical protein
MVALAKSAKLPLNYDIIYSNSGKQKQMINEQEDRHTRIFDTADDLNSAGYVDSSEYDLNATKWYSDSNKIGLIFH